MGSTGIVISREPLATSLPPTVFTTDAVRVTFEGPGMF